MINLFDTFNEKAKDLKKSLELAGYDNETIILKDDGFLPDGLTSPTAFFTGMYAHSEDNLMPKFFNEIKVPEFWEIRGNNQAADIFSGYKKKGHINFKQDENYFRSVNEVEWFNDTEKKRQVDLYNKYGILFGKKTFSDGELTLTTYLNNEKQEVILINHINNTVQVNYEGKKYLFESIVDYLVFYLEVSKIDMDRIFFNSLSTPYFVTSRINKKYNPKKSSILFWQEISETMPGNMKSILNNRELNIEVIAQNFDEYARLRKQVDSGNKLDNLGFIYEFKQNTSFNKEIFILTNSDNISNLSEIVNLLPEWTFNIAAFTEMSDKLMSFQNTKNVKLYPNIDYKKVEYLANECSIYLDINHGKEVDNIVRRVFDNNRLIIAFEDTAHNRQFVNFKSIISKDNAKEMINRIKEVSGSYEIYSNELKDQHWYSGQTTIDEYRGKIN